VVAVSGVAEIDRDATVWSGTSEVSQHLSVMPAQPPVAVAV
jgi:hypothetical protein